MCFYSFSKFVLLLVFVVSLVAVCLMVGCRENSRSLLFVFRFWFLVDVLLCL